MLTTLKSRVGGALQPWLASGKFWTMSQYPSPPNTYWQIFSPEITQENSTLELNTISTFTGELIVCTSAGPQIHSSGNYNYKSCQWDFYTILRCVLQDLGTHLHPPLRTHTSSLSRRDTPRPADGCAHCVFICSLLETDRQWWM